MLASILITGGDEEQRKEKALWQTAEFLGKPPKNNPDFYLIEEEQSIKITQIRELKKRLSLKPFSSLNIVVLLNRAETMTIPAQNSLLKILEEPPLTSKIILTAPNPTALLPTIVSRCQLVRINETNHDPEESIFKIHLQFLNQILTSSPGQRILMSEEYSQTKEKAVEFCQNQLLTLRKVLHQETDKTSVKIALKPVQIAKIMRSLQKALVLLKSNVNPKILLENLLISYSI
jgi:DNA polymerase III delta prime subunit